MRSSGFAQSSRQRGMALLLVLWVIVLISVISSSFLLSAGTEAMTARNMLDTTRARQAAESGLHRAVYELRNPDPNTRWLGDGRSYVVGLDDIEVEIKLWDETGKVDIGQADAVLLSRLFETSGIERLRAEAMANAVIDWRDPDDLVSEPGGAEARQYKQADLAYGPRNRPFETLSELQQVLGMDYELFLELEPAITINSYRPQPNPAFAPAGVLRLLPGFEGADVNAFLLLRQQATLTNPVTMPDGTPLIPQGGGLTYTVQSRATLPSGAQASFEATIQMGAGGIAGRPFRVLRWRDTES
jgi:general secretion pathway protein K